jgi:hypothetical protein
VDAEEIFMPEGKLARARARLADPERVEVGVAVPDVPEMLDQRKLIFDRRPLI